VKALLLFDIDGTLILGSNAGITAYLRAVQKRHNVTVRREQLSRSCGKTDFIVLREVLDLAGLHQEDERDPELIRAYLAELVEAVKEDPGVLAPGLRELLERLGQEKDMVLALGTGNIQAGARVKLARHNVDSVFPTGGFAEDGNTRSQIIAAAAARAAEVYQEAFSKIVVIGDTPSDIQCARDNGFYAVAVATGSFSRDELMAAQPDLVLDDLTDAVGFIEYVRRLPESPGGRGGI